MSSLVDGNKSDVSSSPAIAADGSDCTRDFPSDPPSNGRGLSVLLTKNTREPLDPSRLTQGITGSVCKSVS